ncbi:hypothetical protein TNCV_4123231 [Trichonephila clavipes]|nr:hypothetical protein TNCV_4123231 [Trichonephila clavipes]
MRLSREQRVGGSLLGYRSRHSFFSPGSSTSASSVHSLNSNIHNNLRYRGVESDLRVSLGNNGLVGPYRLPFSSLFLQPRIIDLRV